MTPERSCRHVEVEVFEICILQAQADVRTAGTVYTDHAAVVVAVVRGSDCSMGSRGGAHHANGTVD